MKRATPILGRIGGVAWVVDELGDGPVLFAETAFGRTPESAMTRLNRKLDRGKRRRLKRESRSLSEDSA
jgi:hypothetical protein